MRPVRLELEGFTSFRKRAVVDFEGLDLFAITGATGAGKTSLLDAILFALYGVTPRLQTREVTSLVSLGSDSVKVLLEFAVGPQKYKVARNRKKATQVSLEEFKEGEWKPVAGGVKETDGKIQNIIGLDFDAFTRAVILPQGEFDRFLRGDTAKRTDILKNLLGIDIYEEMKQKANRIAGDVQAQVLAKEGLLTSTYGAATPERVQELRESVRSQELALKAHQQDTAKLEALVPVATELEQLRAQEKQAATDIEAARAALQKAVQDAAAAEESKQRCEAKIAQVDQQITATGYVEQDWVALHQAVPQARQKGKLEGELAARRKERQQKGAEATQSAAQVSTDTSALEAAQTKIQQARAALDAARQAHEGLTPAALLQQWRKDLASAAPASVEEAEAAFEHLRAQGFRAHLEQGEPCPVCEQIVKKLPHVSPTSLDDLEQARKALQSAQQAHAQWEAANRNAGGRTVAQLDVLIAEEAEAKAALTAATREHEQALAAQQQAEKRLTASQHQQQLAEQQMANLDATIKQLQTQLRDVAAELAKYPDWAPLPLTELEASLEDQNNAKQRRDTLLFDKEQAQKALNQALASATEQAARQLSLKDKIESLEASIATYKLKAKLCKAQLPEDADLYILQAKLRTAAALRDSMMKSLASQQAQLEHTERQVAEAKTLREEIENLREEANLYHDMGLLLKDNEFVAYVQREAMKSLAAAASIQLEDLSEKRYTLTLGEDSNDFHVVDHWNGSERRSVRTLSGGESFLASLSLALALSDGIAGYSEASAKARLESLFIDEGISSLDPDALDTAIAALASLKDRDRRMVGVISHIAELGSRLPAQIQVEKEQGGSRVVIRTHSHSMVAGGL
ncbi:MAG: SMC family ATPase [Bryobacteraceae bacterium]